LFATVNIYEGWNFKLVTILSQKLDCGGVRGGSYDPKMYINDTGKKSSHETNEYYNYSNNNNNNKLLEQCNTIQTKECCRLFLGNIMTYLFNECWFINFASNKTVKIVVYSFNHHTRYDMFWPVIAAIIT